MHNTLMKTGLFLSSLLLASGIAQASVFQFDLQGKAGAGLLGGNENPAAGTAGIGGEIGPGISYDDVSNILTIFYGWGTVNGFASDLTGPAIANHIHGPTTADGTGSFTQNANVKYSIDSLVGYNSSASSGGFIGTVTILEADEAGLLAGKFYINVHTVAFGGGEIRGNLVTAVPEPAETAAVTGGLIGAFALLRRYRSKNAK